VIMKLTGLSACSDELGVLLTVGDDIGEDFQVLGYIFK
jgi:hypothetical protein